VWKDWFSTLWQHFKKKRKESFEVGPKLKTFPHYFGWKDEEAPTFRGKSQKYPWYNTYITMLNKHCKTSYSSKNSVLPHHKTLAPCSHV